MLVICGTGALLPELQAVARSAGVERHVTFAGLVDNARRRPLLRRRRSLRPAVAARGAADGRGRGARMRHARHLVGQSRRRRAARRVRRRRRGGAEGAARRRWPRAISAALAAEAADPAVHAGDRRAAVPRRRGGAAVLRRLRGSDRPMTLRDRARGGGRAARGAAGRRVGGALLRVASGAARSSSIAICRGLLSGVYSPERDEASGLTFAWTGADVVAAAARSRSRQELDARSARSAAAAPLPADNPDVTVVADGVTLATVHTSDGVPGRAA